jgi:glyoxylase-like metal-dependent hydrolase (beta-lactamase superfamily II)
MPSLEIHTLDLCFRHWPESIASYLLIAPGGPVLVETGPPSTLPTLTRELAQRGISPGDVKKVLVTHIHLDHAGAAGWWARQGATVFVHHFGAPHLIDPSRLLASARRIYGDRMEEMWGEVLPTPAERVIPLHDGEKVELDGFCILALDTAGHARHHLVYLLEQAAFTGDAAGIRVPGQPFLQVPTVPPEFDLIEWQRSLARLRARGLSTLYLTHFGPVHEVEEHLSALGSLLAEFAERVRQELIRGSSRDEIIQKISEWELERRRAQSSPTDSCLEEAGFGTLGTYVDGIIRYWSKLL